MNTSSRVSISAVLLVLSSFALYADVGIAVYESKGPDSRKMSAGHIALIATGLCAEGMDRIRECNSDETPGIVIHRYAALAVGYPGTIMVVPLPVHLVAATDPLHAPVLSSGGTLEAMQIEYWRDHLRPYIQPLSEEQYRQMRARDEKFDAGRTFRRIVSFEYLGMLFGGRGAKHYDSEPYALRDPKTRELVPNGRWREVVGANHQRSMTFVTARTTVDQEKRLIDFLRKFSAGTFNALSDNCSDFARTGLLAVFRDSGLHFRPRAMGFANAWITSPISVATDFTGFIKRTRLPSQVEFHPMLAGTRRPTLTITSLARGTLIPNPQQGKIVFGIKVGFNIINPLVIATAFGVDEASRFVNLERLVHQQSGGNLSELAGQVAADPAARERLRPVIRREQMRVFGTPECWERKRQEFRTVAAAALERGALRSIEVDSMLESGRPFVLPRIYEKTARDMHKGGDLVAGTVPCVSPDCSGGIVMAFLPSSQSATPAGAGSWHPAKVPDRAGILEMAQSSRPVERESAFRLMTSVVNFDLASDGINRRTTERFDRDWHLFLEVAESNGIAVTRGDSVESCSCRAYDSGEAKRDAYGRSSNLPGYVARQVRNILYSPAR